MTVSDYEREAVSQSIEFRVERAESNRCQVRSQHNYRGIVLTERILERRPYVYCVTTIESHAAIKLIKYVLVARKL